MTDKQPTPQAERAKPLDLETARAYADANIMPIAEFVTKYGDQLND